ncbi:hypothetical protein L580_3302 [Serratia fonticola AU-P3(3)]|nr:hypothetical protein L580_3302 [Serratia fonticola AU-P3(3)]
MFYSAQAEETLRVMYQIEPVTIATIMSGCEAKRSLHLTAWNYQAEDSGATLINVAAS